jgi:hypothetical protein
MNLFNFTANFGSEEACRLHFKEERDKIGVECKCGVVLRSIFGYKAVGVMNVKSVEVEFHYEAEQSCKVQSYPF